MHACKAIRHTSCKICIVHRIICVQDYNAILLATASQLAKVKSCKCVCIAGSACMALSHNM